MVTTPMMSELRRVQVTFQSGFQKVCFRPPIFNFFYSFSLSLSVCLRGVAVLQSSHDVCVGSASSEARCVGLSAGEEPQ